MLLELRPLLLELLESAMLASVALEVLALAEPPSALDPLLEEALATEDEAALLVAASPETFEAATELAGVVIPASSFPRPPRLPLHARLATVLATPRRRAHFRSCEGFTRPLSTRPLCVRTGHEQGTKIAHPLHLYVRAE